MEETALITNEAVVFGLLMALLGLIFWAASEARFKKFFSNNNFDSIICFDKKDKSVTF